MIPDPVALEIRLKYFPEYYVFIIKAKLTFFIFLFAILYISNLIFFLIVTGHIYYIIT